MLYFSPSYNEFGNPDEKEAIDLHEHHVFNEQKNAFIDAKHYVEGEEHNLPEDSFDNMSIIYEYKVLTEYTKESIKHKIAGKPLFQVSCD